MKKTTSLLFALSLTGSIANAALVSLNFSDYANGTIKENDLVTNTGTLGGAARWVVNAPVNAAGQVDTTTNDGHMRFDGTNGSSLGGFAMNLATTSYTFNARLSFAAGSTDTNQGLFGQINIWTTTSTEWWIRKNGTDFEFLIQDTAGNSKVGTFAIGSALGAGFHDISFELNHTAQEMRAYIDGTQIGSSVDISSVTGIVGEAGKKMNVGAYNDTNTNRFDGLAESYSIVATIPEPSAAALLGLGGFALLLRRRK